MAHVIFYGPSPAAIAAERVYLLPPLDEAGLEHPLGRFVAWMALYAHRVEHGELPGPFDPEDAERYARRALIDGHQLRTLAHLDDAGLAEQFQVPVEQIHFRRADLDLPPNDNGHREAPVTRLMTVDTSNSGEGRLADRFGPPPCRRVDRKALR